MLKDQRLVCDMCGARSKLFEANPGGWTYDQDATRHTCATCASTARDKMRAAVRLDVSRG